MHRLMGCYCVIRRLHGLRRLGFGLIGVRPLFLSRVLFPTRFDTENQPVIEELHEVKTMLAERVKEWNKESMERGLQRGLQKGLQKGLEKGLQKGALQLLTRLLEKKFGNLPQDLERRLNQADEEQILQWSERILTADTLGDIFGN